jgi:hypothetical protein
MKRRKAPRDAAKELEDQARLSSAWRTYHQQQLDDALAGPSGVAVGEVMNLLARIERTPAATLLACVQGIDWSTVSCDVKLTVLHQVNEKITHMREKRGIASIDDPLPGQPDNAFRRIKSLLFP